MKFMLFALPTVPANLEERKRLRPIGRNNERDQGGPRNEPNGINAELWQTRTARAVPRPLLCRNSMISRITRRCVHQIGGTLSSRNFR